MTPPRFDNSLSWNLILSLVLAVIAGGLSYGATGARLSAVEVKQDKQEAAIAAKDAQIMALKDQMDVRLRDQNNQTDAKLDRVNAAVDALRSVVNAQAVQLGRIETTTAATLTNFERLLRQLEEQSQ